MHPHWHLLVYPAVLDRGRRRTSLLMRGHAGEERGHIVSLLLFIDHLEALVGHKFDVGPVAAAQLAEDQLYTS